MTCNGYLLRRTGAMTATFALVAGGCFVVSGATAQTVVGEGVSEIRKTTTSSAAAPVRKWSVDASAAPAAGDGSSERREESWWKKLWPSPSYIGAAPKDVPLKDKKAESAVEPAAAKGGSTHSKEDLFRPDPLYEVKYDAKAQTDIYGAKTEVDPPRPLLELGRPQYTSGAYEPSSTLLGELNPLLPGLSIYGDWRTAVAYNSNKGKDVAQFATRLNLDVDFKFTGTERIHAFFTPIQKNNKFTRYEFGGGDGDGKFSGEFDLNPQTLFFEGDAGALFSGFTGRQAGFDLPFTVGLFPLFLQNGIWANDAILGAAVSVPAKNSAKLGLSNFDTTFFAAFDNVDNVALLGPHKHNAHLYGATIFLDAFKGYVEAGYAVIQGTDGPVDGQVTHFATAAYSRRFANTWSNSTRLFANFGNGRNDDGFAIISENSLVTSLPSTLIPYFNFFAGFGHPLTLVDGNGAGILKNVGINFETDALTGYPKLDDTASGAWGGAIGLQYLFNLDQQLLFEVATVQPFDTDGIGAQRPQYGFGVRYQIPLSRAWLFRADATYQIQDGGPDSFGFRTEMRRKF